MTVRLLIIDDDPDHCANLSDFCEDLGWTAQTACSAHDAEYFLHKEAFSLIALDVTMPGMDGVTFCRRLRERGVKVPILMLTANNSVAERIDGLRAGADDYLGKPFSLNEFEARVSAILRRTAPEKLIVEDLVYDLSTHRATRAGNPLKIKGIAQRILEELMKASPEIVDREHLTAAIWPDDDVPDADSLRANIYLLRQAVDKPFATALIRTHTGAGWSIGRSQR